MKTSEKKVGELAIKLNDKKTSVVVSAIDTLRFQDPFSGAIKLLVSLYDSSETPVVRDNIRSFMNDLKDPAAREEVIAEIKKPHGQDTISMLVSSCWQSGLDYTPWAADLATVFCTADYATALECFTVIEESAFSLNAGKKKELISILKKNDNSKGPEKSLLLRELISILSQTGTQKE